MASPQKENGFTPIANELLEALAKTNLSGTQFAMIFAIMRKTYGFHKKQDQISITQFMEMLGVSRRTVIYNLQDLEAKSIVFVKRVRLGEKNEVNIISLNKDYDAWVVQNSAPQVERNRGSAKQRRVVQNSVEGSANSRTKVVHGFAPTKETTKDNTKDTSKGEPLRSYNPLGAEVIKAFESVDPKNKKYYGNTTQRDACNFLIEEYGLEEVNKRIVVLPRTNKMPYFPTITTPVQLRDKWVQLQDAVDRLKAEKQSKNVVAF